MAWDYAETVEIGQQFTEWYARILLRDTYTLEERGAFLRFGSEPSLTQAEVAGRDHALRLNIEEAPQAPGRVIPRAEFVGRFTLPEIGAIYSAASSNTTLLAFTKKLELYDVVNLDSDDVITGLALLEQAGLIAVGRANVIRWV